MKNNFFKINDFKEMQILESDRSNSKRYCRCGHSIVFPKTSKKDKIICRHCGSYVFKNDLLEFKYRLEERAKKM